MGRCGETQDCGQQLEEEEEERVMERGRVEGLDYTAHKVTDCLVADSPLCPSFLSFFSFFFFPPLWPHVRGRPQTVTQAPSVRQKHPSVSSWHRLCVLKVTVQLFFFCVCVVEWGCSTESRTHCTVRTGFLTSTQTKGKGGF